MKHTSIDNRKYNTIESLTDASGDFNAALSKNPNFKNLEIYEKILEQTELLNQFDGIEFKHRFEFVKDGLRTENCVKCGKPFIFFPKSGKRFALCRHKQILDSGKFRQNLKDAKRGRIVKFMENAKHGTGPVLSDEKYHELLTELWHKKPNYAFIVSCEKYEEFYYDLIYKTKNLLPFDENDIRIPERLYIQFHGLTEKPKCAYCGGETPFVNRFSGYRKSCPTCADVKTHETLAESCRRMIDENFDFGKYEIIEYPRVMSRDELTIKCLKCGHTSKWTVKDDRLKNSKTRLYAVTANAGETGRKLNSMNI